MCLRDLSLLVDDVGNAPRVLVFRTVARAIAQTDGTIFVGQQREREPELLRKPLVLVRRIEADAEDLRVFIRVLRREVPEPGTFSRSAGCIRLRIEPEDHFLPPQIGQLDALSFMRGSFEIRSSITRVEHLSTFHVSNEGSKDS